MKCADCNLWYIDINSIWPRCHADPNWPAPCEYEGDYEEEEEEKYKWVNEWGEVTLVNVPWIETDWDDIPRCATCIHDGDFTLDDVACCNCCENYSFYERREED